MGATGGEEISLLGKERGMRMSDVCGIRADRLDDPNG